MIPLDIISDPICPWCYIGKAHLDRAVAETGIDPFTTTWRVFQLNPDMPTEGMDRGAYLEAKFGGAAAAAELYGRIEAAAREAGLKVAFDRIARTPNSFDAHRLIRWAQTTGNQSAVVDQLFRRYFEAGEDISDHAVLLAVAESAGMDRAVVARLLASDADRAELEAEEAEARRMGVSGVPCFLVNRRFVLQGAQPVETWTKVITELDAALAAESGAAS